MQNKKLAPRFVSRLLAGLAALLTAFAVSPAFAATYYWDCNTNTAGFGTAGGTWQATTPATATNGWTLTAAGNTGLTNATILSGDIVNFGTATVPLAAGTITVSGTVTNTTLNINNYAPGSGSLTLSGGTIRLAGTTPSINVQPTNTPNTIASAIELTTGSTIAFDMSSAAVGTLNLNGVISGTGPLTITTPNVNSGNNVQTINLGAASTYTGNTTFTTGNGGNTVTIVAGVINALPTTTVLTVDGNAGSGSGRTLTYNLNSKNQTLAGLISTSGNNLRTQVITSSGAATLTVSNTASQTYGWGGTNGTLTSAVSLTKQGSGTLTLGGLNTFTGGVTISGGTLAIGVAGDGTKSALGNVVSTRTITVTNGGFLRAGVIGGIFNNNFATAATSLPALNLAGGTLTNTGTARNSSLGNLTLADGTLSASVGHPTGYGSWNLNGTVTSTGTSTISSSTNLPITLSAAPGSNTTFNVTSGTLTASAELGQVTAAGDERISSLTKIGAGTMILNNTNTYTGDTTISNGTFSVNGSSVSATTVKSGATLGGSGTVNAAVTVESGGLVTAGNGTSGTLTVSSLTFSGAGTNNIGTLANYTSVAAINVTNALTLGGGPGAVVINLPTTSVASGTYHLIQVGSGIIDTNGFTLGTAPGLTFRQTSAVLQTNGNYLDLVVSGTSFDNLWTGALSSEWSTSTLGSPKNWSYNASQSDFYAGDPVLFDNSGAKVVDISVADVLPLSVTFTNTTGNDYTVTGTAGIAGSTSLTKQGTGKVTFNNTNTYTGGTTISGGTLQLGDGIATNGVVAGSILNNAALVVANPAAQTMANLISGSGTLAKTNAGILTLNNANTYSGGTTVSAGGGTLQATITQTANALGTGAVSVGSGSTLILDDQSTTSVANVPAITNAFTGSGLLKLQFAAGATARNTYLTNVSGFGGTIQLSNLGTTGDKWNAGNIGTVAGSLIVDSGSGIFVNGGNAAFTGGITLNGAGTTETRGAVRMAGVTLDGNITLASSSIISMESTASALITGNITNSVAGANLTLGGTSATGGTLSGNISDGAGILAVNQAVGSYTLSGNLSHSGGVNVTNNGILTLSGTNNTYTGVTAIGAGAGRSILVTTNGALGATGTGNETTIGAAGQLGFSGGMNYTATEKIIGSGTGNTSGQGIFTNVQRGFIQSVTGSNTFAGDIEVTAASRIGTQEGAQLTMAGVITQTTGNILFRTGSGTGDFVTLANAGNSFGGDSTVFNAATGVAGNYAGVRLGVTNGLPTNLSIYGFNGSAAGTALDLNGKDQTLNGLVVGTSPGPLKIINLDTVNASTLTLNPTADQTTTLTTILGGGGLGVINLVKDGAFTQTLSGTNTYSGDTTISTGTLQIGGAGQLGGGSYAGLIINNAALDYASSAAQTLSGIISGSGTLTKTNASTLTLSGANTYTNTTTVNAGTLAITHSNALGTTVGATTIIGGNGTSANTLSLSSATNDLTIAENINLFGNAAGRAQLINNSAFNHTLTGAIDASSSTNLAQLLSTGTGSITVSGDITGTLSDGAVLFVRGTSTSANNRLLGSVNLTGGNFAKTDAGTWLVGASGKTYSWANTILANGTLIMGVANVLPSTTGLLMGESGVRTPTLNLNGFDQTVASITYNGGTGTRTITSATPAILTVTNATDNPSLGSGANSVALTGSLGLIKTGVGTLILPGANTYTGATLINAGKLQVDGSSVSGATVSSGATLGGSGLVNAQVTVAAGGSVTAGDGTNGTLTVSNLTFSGTSTVAIGTVSGYANVAAINVTNVLTPGSAVTLNLSTVSAANGTYHLIQFGSASLITTTNGFVLGTTPVLTAYQTNFVLQVNGNYLDLVVSGTNSYWTGNESSVWSTNVFAGAKNWTNNVSAVDYQDFDTVVFNDLAGNKTVDISGTNVTPAGVTFTNTAGVGNVYTVTGTAAIAGSASLTKQGDGVVNLNNTNTYTGLTIISGGTVNLGGSITGGTAITVNGSGVLAESASGVISGASSLTHASSGTSVLAAANPYTGGTTISAGTLQVDVTNAIGTGGLVMSGGTLSNNVTAALPNQVSLSAVATVGVGAAQTLTLTGVITDSGALAKTGTGTLTLTGANSYTNTTTITGGTLVLRNNSFTSGVIVNTNTTLQYSPTANGNQAGAGAISLLGNMTYAPVTTNYQVLGTSGTNKIVTVSGGESVINILPGAALVAGNGGLYLDGGLQGSSAVTVNATVNGFGLVLRTPGSTYSGAMTVNGTASTTAGTGSGLVIGFLAGTGNATMSNANLTINGTLELGNSTAGMGWAAGTTANLTGQTFSMNALNGTGAIVGNFAATATRTLSVGNNGGTGTFAGVIANGVNNTMSLTKEGSGTQTLSGTNTYTGATTISGGTLRIGGVGRLGSGSYAGNITNNAALDYASSAAQTLSGVISGTGSLTNSGVGTLTLTGTNTYTGNTTVSNGTLVIAVASLATNSTVSVAAGAVLQLNFAETNSVAGFVTNGVSLAAGVVYNAGNVSPFIAGAGSLEVVSAAPAVSTNAYLTSLALSAGTLSPFFSSNTLAYTATNAYSLTPITVTVTNADLTATNTLITNGVSAGLLASGAASPGIPLKLGAANLIQVRVMAQDGLTTNLYTVNVTMAPNLAPPTLTRTPSNGVLSLSWPADRLGYTLQVQTNARSLGLRTNWFPVAGSSSVTSTNLPVDNTQGTVFYRLVYP